MFRFAAALLLAPAIAVAQTGFWARSELDCLPREETLPPARPLARPGASDPGATHLSFPVNDTFGSGLVWDVVLDSPEVGTVQSTHPVWCSREGGEVPRSSPFDLSPTQ